MKAAVDSCAGKIRFKAQGWGQTGEIRLKSYFWQGAGGTGELANTSLHEGSSAWLRIVGFLL